MTRRRALPALLGALGLWSCQRGPEWYAPPAQYTMPAGPEPRVPPPQFRPLLYMQDPDLDARVISGVIPAVEGDDWRWTNEQARFRLVLESNQRLEFFLLFTLSDEQLAETGPPAITVRANGQVLTRPRFEKPGMHEYSIPVPAAVLPASGPVEVQLDVEPCWQRGTTKYGLWLQALGFRPRTR